MLHGHRLRQCLLLGSIQITVRAMPAFSSDKSNKWVKVKDEQVELSGKVVLDLGYKQSLFIELNSPASSGGVSLIGEYCVHLLATINLEYFMFKTRAMLSRMQNSATNSALRVRLIIITIRRGECALNRSPLLWLQVSAWKRLEHVWLGQALSYTMSVFISTNDLCRNCKCLG